MGEAKQPQKDFLSDRNIKIIEGEVDMSKYFTIREASEILKCSLRTVRNRIESQQIRSVYNEIGAGKSRYLIPKDAIEKATIVKDVVELNRAMDPNKFIATLREENKELQSKMDIVIEQNRGLNARVIGLEEMMEMVMEKLGEKNKAPQLSFWEKLRSLFG